MSRFLYTTRDGQVKNQANTTSYCVLLLCTKCTVSEVQYVQFLKYKYTLRSIIRRRVLAFGGDNSVTNRTAPLVSCTLTISYIH